jgi:hypothetical protein
MLTATGKVNAVCDAAETLQAQTPGRHPRGAPSFPVDGPLCQL